MVTLWLTIKRYAVKIKDFKRMQALDQALCACMLVLLLKSKILIKIVNLWVTMVPYAQPSLLKPKVLKAYCLRSLGGQSRASPLHG